MSIWIHSDAVDSQHLELHRPSKCHFCKTQMRVFEVDDCWSQPDSFYLKHHYDWMFEGEDSFLEIHGLYDEPWIWRIVEDSPSELYVSVSVCPGCGWWNIYKQVSLDSHAQVWDLMFRAEGALQRLELNDVDVPLREVRDFLTARYESRFCINPRKFEEVVESVFRDFGYDTTTTAYSGDGGIDVILHRQNDELIGVQVKRHRHSITAEQIRSFAGALMIGNYTSGIFVTTSRYQSGATATAAQAATTCVPIQLLDANAFFKALRIAQLHGKDASIETLSMLTSGSCPDLFYIGQYHRNSL